MTIDMFGDTEKAQQTIGSLIGKNRIVILPGRRNKADVLNRLIDLLEDETGITSRDELAGGIFHREAVLSTAIGNGLALPHFRMVELDRIFIALAICRDGITDYHSPDNLPVRLVFLIVSGNGQKAQHIGVMAKIGELFKDGRLAAACFAASSPTTCLEILARAEQ